VRSTALLLGAAYVLGSVPFAYLVARHLGGVDVRQVGSGNVGAANVLRATRPATAALATLLDFAKGAAAVWIAGLIGAPNEWRVAAGAAAIVGHVYPVWLRFRGGKGVATACGMFAVLAPRETAVAVAVFVLAVWRTRFVSLGSLAAAVTLPLAIWATRGPVPLLAGAGLVAAFIVFKHRSNIGRLWAGTERRLGQGV
jgi:glycerol-3-phosphate acyltransferase PlsY